MKWIDDQVIARTSRTSLFQDQLSKLEIMKLNANHWENHQIFVLRQPLCHGDLLLADCTCSRCSAECDLSLPAATSVWSFSRRVTSAAMPVARKSMEVAMSVLPGGLVATYLKMLNYLCFSRLERASQTSRRLLRVIWIDVSCQLSSRNRHFINARA